MLFADQKKDRIQSNFKREYERILRFAEYKKELENMKDKIKKLEEKEQDVSGF